MIAVPGVGMIVSGIFNTDAGDPPSTTEILHSRASGIAFTMLILAAVTSSRTQRSDLQPARFTRLTTLLPVVAAAAGGAGVALHDTRWTGLGQRLLCIVLLAWLLLTAHQLQALGSRGSPWYARVLRR